MDFKTYIDGIIKKYADTLTKGKKRSKFSTSTTNTLESLYKKSPNANVFFDQFGKIKYSNDSFHIILKNDKNKMEITSIYDMFTIDADFYFDAPNLYITYANGFKKVFELIVSIVNIEQNYLIHLDFFDISKLSLSVETQKNKAEKITSMLGFVDELLFSTDKELFINFSVGSSPFIEGSEEKPKTNLIDNNIFEVFPTTFCNEIKSTLEKGGFSFTYTYSNGSKDMVFECKIREHKDEYFFIVKDISNLQSMSNALNYLSNYDVLTSFLNSANLGPALESISSYNYLPIGVEKIRINNIKEINENLGYETGDKILSKLSKKVKSLITGFEITCRVSGEEFAVIFPNTSKEFLQGFHSEMYGFFEKLKKAYPEQEINFSLNNLFLNDTCESYKDEILQFLI